MPSYIASFPSSLNPSFLSESLISSSVISLNADASASRPESATNFDAIISSSCPSVILLGIACGLIIMSGVMPSAVKGISSSGTISATTPFWPWRDANLSPSSGILSLLTFILISLLPLIVSDIITLSTIPSSPCLIVSLVSLLFSVSTMKLSTGPKNLKGDTFPISTSPDSTCVSRLTMPSCPRFA